VILLDVNVLVYACREDAPLHAEYFAWLTERTQSHEAFALSELVLSGALRVLTHPRVFNPPTPLTKALEFVEALRRQPNCVIIAPGPRHWQIFRELCERSNAKGNLVPDAYHAALALEHGCEWITTDRDYARFPGLRWRHPISG
jgi:toxin-antitoxin system PIN domain toxin